MRVLILDPQASFAELLAVRLREDGHDVSCADNPEKMDALLRIRGAEAVVVDLSRRRMNGFDIARALRAEHGPGLRIALTSSVHQEGDAEAQVLLAEVQALGFYPRSVSPDLLAGDLLRAVSKPPPSPPRAVNTGVRAARPVASPAPQKTRASRKAKPVSWDNARAFVAIWAARSSGSLSFERESILISDGGLVDPASIGLVERALGGGTISFSEQAVDGFGDWALLGNQVFVRCRSACSQSSVLGYMGATLIPTDSTQMARGLAITGPTRRLLGKLDGELQVEALLDQCQCAPSEVSADLEALIQLELLALRRGERKELEPRGGELSVEVTNKQASALKRASASADLEGLPALEQLEIAKAANQDGPGAIHARLLRELETVASAAPPVVLGVPADANTSLVDTAAARMRERYARLSRDSALPEQTQVLAERMGRIIQDAHRHFSFHDHIKSGSGDVSERVVDDGDEVDLLLAEGRKLIARGEWSQADTVLTRAHRYQLDHAGVLSNLGWARLHNPLRDEESRVDEGRDFLLLGEQFDPKNPDGQYFLAQYLLAANLLEAASQRAERAKQAVPGEPARTALYRKIQVKLQASKP